MTIARHTSGRPGGRAAVAAPFALTALTALSALSVLVALAWPADGVGRASHVRASPARGHHGAKAHRARAHHAHARALHASDRASLHYVSSSVNVFYETGRATGTLPGFMRVHMRLGYTFSGRYVIETSGGSIRGHGSATPHGSGTYESFAGTIAVTGGTGRFRHAHGHARVYGTFDRMNNRLTLHTTGTLHY